MPRGLLRELGVQAIERRPFELADQRTVDHEVGEARIGLEGRDRTALVVFGPKMPFRS